MDKFIKFFSEIGKLKEMPRRGWVIRGIKNPESIADHTFRVSIMAWILAGRKKNFNLEKLIKMALIHDLCEIYAGDITPYDSILPRSKKKREELLKTWPRFSEQEKKRLAEEKFKKENEGLETLIKDLPPKVRSEIKNLWLDYEKGLSKEGRFFKQMDRVENLLQAMEYWKKYGKPAQGPWWTQIKELYDDPVLFDFVEAMGKEFHNKRKPKV